MDDEQKTFDRAIWSKGHKSDLGTIIYADLPHFQCWINDRDTNRYLMRDHPTHQTGQEAWYENVTKSDADNIRLAILDKASGRLIGNIHLAINVRNQSATTGTMIGDPDYRGLGYATDAKMQILEYAFNRRGVRKVTSKILALNDKSLKYAKRCGYRYMATIEQEHFRDGGWIDEQQFVVFYEGWLPHWECYQKHPDWFLRRNLETDPLWPPQG